MRKPASAAQEATSVVLDDAGAVPDATGAVLAPTCAVLEFTGTVLEPARAVSTSAATGDVWEFKRDKCTIQDTSCDIVKTSGGNWKYTRRGLEI